MFPISEILVGKISQASWDVMSPELRSEVERMANELTAGIAKYAPAAERCASLAEYHEMAERHGTTLATVMRKYVSMENLLSSDPVEGIKAIIRNTGRDPLQWARTLLEYDPEAA
jgi:hypothetical protein